MVKRYCYLTVLALLALVGCASSDSRLPTQAALLSFPTQAPATSTPAATVTPRLTLVPPPTAVPSPSPAPLPWLLAYDSDVQGNDELYLLPADGGPAVNLTHHPAEDRFPAWSPDGTRIAFQSNRDGNWEIYTLDLRAATLNRLTFDPAYDGAPAWSPNGAWIAFESYRDTAPCQLGTPVPDPPPCPDLEIYRVPSGGGAPQRLTDSPQGDYQPLWSPDGDWIAFTSWRDGERGIYVMPSGGGPARSVTAGDALALRPTGAPAWSLDGQALVFPAAGEGVTELYRWPCAGGPAVRLTSDGLPKERPTVAADGSLIFARYDPGPAFEVYDPYRPGAYNLYRLPPDAGPAQLLFATTRARHPAVAPLADLSAVATREATGQGLARVYAPRSPSQLDLQRLDDFKAPDPRLVAGVDEALRAWRAAVHARSGHDFLGQLSDVLRPIGHYHHRLGYMSWHKAGRAVDLLFDWRDADGQDALYVVREDIAGEVYWRLFLKCTLQDGSMGEPLTQAPWYFWWHTTPEEHPETFANGGQRLPIPAGYFVDVTALAERYGWSRIAAYHLEDFHWQRDSTATEYWHYQYSAGLTWYQAMAQIYPPELLAEFFSRPVAAAREQTEEVMDGKGLPPTVP